jgi:NDP-hexose 2,3-dehydratase
VLHVLMQAKMEPGNPNLMQLSPTVQAARSNYTGAPRGGPVRYLEHFIGSDCGRVLVDALQSDHGSWYPGPNNRELVVETEARLHAGEGFCWLPLGQVGQLLRTDNVVNMYVDAPDREVGGWSQPLLEPRGHGFVALFVRRFSGVPHPLVAARAEAGFAGRRVNVQARSLLAALVTGAVEI